MPRREILNDFTLKSKIKETFFARGTFKDNLKLGGIIIVHTHFNSKFFYEVKICSGIWKRKPTFI